MPDTWRRSTRRRSPALCAHRHPSPAARTHRVSGGTRCSDTGARPDAARRFLRVRSGSLSRRYLQRRPARCRVCRNRTGARRSPRTWSVAHRSCRFGRGPRASLQRCPATLAISRLQLTTALPSMSTVQHPHWPDGEQPSFGLVDGSSSRRRSRCGWSPTSTGAPFSVNRVRVTPVLREVYVRPSRTPRSGTPRSRRD